MIGPSLARRASIIFTSVRSKDARTERARYRRRLYFLQEWGYQAWNTATTSPITKKILQKATKTVVRRLDQIFFRVRFDRLTSSEKHFLRVTAELGAGPRRTGDVAESLGVKISSLGPVRAELIKKGMIYGPAYEELAFTTPLFNEFRIRAMPALHSE